jgi:hypothetical protein
MTILNIRDIKVSEASKIWKLTVIAENVKLGPRKVQIMAKICKSPL